jgi:ABC-2 type transport system permease protein
MAQATLTQPIAGRVARRTSRWSAYWALYTLTLRQHLHGKRWLVMSLLFLLPVGLAVLVRWTARDVPTEMLEFTLGMMFVPQALLPIAALLYASGIIQDDEEEQTITYLLLRPISKWAIYTIKLLAAMTTTAALVVLFTALMYVAIYLGTSAAWGEVVVRWLKASSIHALSIVTYCSLFGLMSLMTKRILVAGILYIAVVEGLLANLPFGIRWITVIYYARMLAYRTMSFQVPRPSGRSEDFAAHAWQLNPIADPQLLDHPQISTCIATLVIASVVFTAIAAWLCSQREFHVKTPEKE